MAIRVRAEAPPGAMLILRMEEVPAPNPPAKRRVFQIASLIALAFVVSLVSVAVLIHSVMTSGITKRPDNMFGDHFNEEFFPFGGIVHLGANDGEQFIGGFARDFATREHFPLQPCDILRRHAAAEDHRTDDRPAPVDCESHHTHLHSPGPG